MLMLIIVIKSAVQKPIDSLKAIGCEHAMKDEFKAHLTRKSEFNRECVCTVKEDTNGSETLKTRCVANGYSQVHGIDYI